MVLGTWTATYVSHFAFILANGQYIAALIDLDSHGLELI